MDSSREILSRLKFIGHLKRNEKVNTKHVYVQPDSLLTSISRTFLSPEGRQTTLTFLNSTFSRAFDILDLHEKTRNPATQLTYLSIVRDLLLSRTGLDNLKYTYQDDIKFCCDIDTLTQLVISRLAGVEPQILREASEKELLCIDSFNVGFNKKSIDSDEDDD